jgi:NAD(P)-dependent dehydrogenase (short-subunit alcohol dehydrogenase family)
VQDAGYYSLLFLCHGLERAGMTAPLRITVVSNYLHCVTDNEIAYPEKMTLMGPCKAIPQEYPNITCRCIDIVMPEAGTPRAADLIARLIAESRLNAPDRVIAYRGKQRWAQTFEPVRLDKQAEPLRQVRQRGVYLITGGLGTVGLLLAEHLARTAQARLVLVGRSGLPPRETWAERAAAHDPGDPISAKIRKMLELEDLGAEVLVLGADVADEAQMRAAITQTYARFGVLHGVLHGALAPGRSLNSPISAIHRSESEAQFRPKVYGLYVLEKLLQGHALDFCLLLSSNSAVLGGLGLLAYSAANLFMDAFAAHQSRAGDIPWISTNWDGWAKATGTQPEQGMLTFVDQYAMTAAEALEAFDRIVRLAPASQVVVSSGDLQARLDLWIRGLHAARANGAAQPAAPTLQPRRIRRNYVAPRDAVERRVAATWQELLGIDQVGIHDHFLELGGHSLLAIQLLSRLRDTFQVELPLRILFEATTVAEVAQQLSAHEAQPGQVEQIALLLEHIEGMAADDVRALLAAKKKARGDI